MYQSEEKIDAVLHYAREHGERPTRPQIRRFQQNGLIPKPRQIGLGRGVGTEVRYPSGTGPQLVAACKASKSGSFRIARWKMWWDRWPTDASRIKNDLLVSLAESQKRDLTPREVRRRLKPLELRQFRKIETMIKTGVMPDSIDANLEKILARAFGTHLRRSASQKSLSELGDFLFRFLKILSFKNLRAALTSASSGELEAARDEVRAFLDVAESLRRLLEILGQPSVGRTISVSMNAPSLAFQRTAVACWLTARKRPEVQAVRATAIARLLKPSPIAESKTE